MPTLEQGTKHRTKEKTNVRIRALGHGVHLAHDVVALGGRVELVALVGLVLLPEGLRKGKGSGGRGEALPSPSVPVVAGHPIS